MTTGAQVQLGVRTGYATGTTCKISVASLDAGEITVSGSWGVTTFPITPAAVGEVTVGYTGSAEITGLDEFTRYTFTVTQGAKSSSGSFMTAPGQRDDFSLFFASCDNNTTHGSPYTTGFWDKVHEYVASGALPTVGVMFVDDHGYVDGNRADDTAGTGLMVSGAPLGKGAHYYGLVSDYAIAYMCDLGMLQDTENPYVAWGRDADRVWCMQNLNYLPQWGDHEFTNDFAFDYNKLTATVVGNTSVSGIAVWAAGKAAWDAFMQPLMPPVFSGSYGWAASYGCVNLIALDSITHGDGTWNRTDLPGVGTAVINSMFGATQIDALLTWLNTPENQRPFNLFGMCNSVRYLTDNFSVTPGAVNYIVYNCGAQHPIYDHCLPEYQQLVTATGNTPPSLMDNPATNGLTGATIWLHGDIHHAAVTHHKKAAYTGNAEENFYSVVLGTISGSTNFNMPIAVGESFGGTELVADSGWTNPEHNYAGTRIDVYGSKSKPELHITLMDSTGATMWAGKWYAKSSNEPVGLAYSLPRHAGTSCKAAV